jgi:hypothetical protein
MYRVYFSIKGKAKNGPGKSTAGFYALLINQKGPSGVIRTVRLKINGPDSLPFGQISPCLPQGKQASSPTIGCAYQNFMYLCGQQFK